MGGWRSEKGRRIEEESSGGGEMIVRKERSGGDGMADENVCGGGSCLMSCDVVLRCGVAQCIDVI